MRWILVSMLTLAACRGPGGAPSPSVPPPAAQEFRVKEISLAGGVVRVHVDIPLVPAGPKPTVIALLADTRQLVGAGFVAVTYTINWALLKGHPPPPAESERTVGKWVLAGPSEATLGEGYLRDIDTTATVYVPMILDWLVSEPDVDPRQIGMVGASTNGFVTLAALAAERRITTAVAVASCGDYYDFLKNSSMGMEGRALTLDRAYARWIDTHEVIRYPERLVHAALLMVHRADDPLIPVSCADATARVLTQAYLHAGHPERFRYLRLPGGGHGYAAPENEAALGWLRDWMLVR